MAMLDVAGLTTRLLSEDGWVHALDDLSISIDKGQTFALVGESGCGKSMTALSIARLLPEAGAVIAGEVWLEALSGPDKGQSSELLSMPEHWMRRVRGKRVSMIFQEPSSSLNPVVTVGDQIAEVIRTHSSLDAGAARAKALEWLKRVQLPEPERRLDQFPFELSGGQKQRVMIAIALAAEPDLLIADEPTTALDVSVQAQILDLLRSLAHETGMAMLLITHDLGIVSQMADHVALMYAGQIVESAPTSEFFKHPRHPYARALLSALPSALRRGAPLHALPGSVPPLTHLPEGCRFASRCAHADELCARPVQWLHGVRCVHPEPAAVSRSNPVPLSDTSAGASFPAKAIKPGSSPLLQVRQLSVAYRSASGWFSYKDTPVLQDLNFHLRAGQTLALVGESGSGKSTAAKAVLQLLSDNAQVQGSVLYAGREMLGSPASRLHAFRRDVQVVFQDPYASLNPRQRVQEIILEGMDQLCPEWSEQDKAHRLAEVLDAVSMPANAAHRFPHEFSGGQRQRIAIARALAVKPRIIFCDEPTSALDVSVQAQVLNVLRELQVREGLSYLFITHNLSVVEYLADDVLVLQGGKTVEHGPVEKVLTQPATEYTRTLLRAIPRVLSPA